MKRSKFTEQQIAFALQQAESGTQVAEVCRKMGISEATFYRWKPDLSRSILRDCDMARACV
jgi:putative transposase